METIDYKQETVLRRATAHDALGIARVHVTSWKETYFWIVPDDYLSQLSVAARQKHWSQMLQSASPQQHFTFVAEVNGEIVGFVDGGLRREDENGIQSELTALYVLRANQKNGLGRRLFCTFVESLRDAGFEDVYAWVLRGNPSAKFFAKMGGNYVKSATVKIGGEPLIEDMYAWKLVT